MTQPFNSIEEIKEAVGDIGRSTFGEDVDDILERLIATAQTKELVEKRDWKKLLRLDKKTDGTFDVVWISNDFPVGEVVKEIDGYFYFRFNHIPYHSSGLYESSFFRALADMLDEMNKEWDEQVRKGIK